MDPATIAAIATLAGGHLRNAASAKAATKQRNWQEYMSNTAYQRQVRDLMKAGINPMLVTKLGGASTPVGAMPSFGNPAAEASQAFSAAQSSGAAVKQAETAERLSDSQIDKINAEVENIKAVTNNLASEEKRIWATTYMLNSQAELMLQQGVSQAIIRDHFRALITRLSAETTLLDNQAAVEAAMNDLGRTVGQFSKTAELLIQLLKGVR